MDRSLKERLVGATVLVALGVVLIPWILNGPNEQGPSPSSEIAIQLPLPDQTAADASTGVRHRTIEIGRDPAASDISAGNTAENSPPPSSSTTSSPTTSSPTSGSPPSQVAAAPTTAPSDPAASPSAPASTAQERSPATVARTNGAAGQADKADEVEVVVASATTLGKGWMVQLGSFGDQGNAKRQADRIKTFGHTPRIFEFSAGGRTMYRVRLGPVDSRETAEATASSLAAHGFVAQLVAPE